MVMIHSQLLYFSLRRMKLDSFQTTTYLDPRLVRLIRFVNLDILPPDCCNRLKSCLVLSPASHGSVLDMMGMALQKFLWGVPLADAGFVVF